MLHLRRYRGFIALAVIVVLGLYQFTSVGDWKSVSNTSVDKIQHWTGTTLPVDGEGQETIEQSGQLEDTNPPVANHADPVTEDLSQEKEQKDDNANRPVLEQDKEGSTPTESTSTLKSVASTEKPEAEKGRYGEFGMGGKGKHDAPEPLKGEAPIHWSKMPEHFPIPSGSIIPLPTGAPKQIPKIQYAFKPEPAEAKVEREQKLDTIKNAFTHSWTGYRKYAWMHDELAPVTGETHDPFCRWAATLVDTLDTLWIMGMEEEFVEAVEAVKTIDFTTTPRKDIPVFETTIRYLGGLLSAYDISGHDYSALLDKAVELADVLMGAFDTPNRLPIMFYFWRPTFTKNPHRAGTRVVMSEIGSLSVEFTRLAQLTKDIKYYDAIARITNEFDAWQDHTKIPGLWPKIVDASGCKKPEVSVEELLEEQAAQDEEPGWKSELHQGPAIEPEEDVAAGSKLGSAPKQDSGPVPVKAQKENDKADLPTEHGTDSVVSADAGSANAGTLSKRQIDGAKEESEDTPAPLINPTESAGKVDCELQGLTSPPSTPWETFTLGALADSTYEYLPKQYMLLGGQVPQYRTMYEKAADAVNESMLYRPMVPDGRDILIAGAVEVTDNEAVERADRFSLQPEHTHLTCFAGGMFGIGAKIFNREADLDIALKLTEGCVWAYEATQTGIMPESMDLIACKSRDTCKWNETLWQEVLDPYRQSREERQQTAEQKATLESPGRLEDPAAPALAANGKEESDPLGVSTTTSNEDEVSKPAPADLPVVDSGQKEPPTSGSNDARDAKLTKRQLGDIDNELDLEASTMTDKFSDYEIPLDFTEDAFISHEDYVQQRIENTRIPMGIPYIRSRNYLLRPEAIESVFIMYRITGDPKWREKGWKMFQAIDKYTKAEYGYSAIDDVTSKESYQKDSMESFWTAETLKYFYLLFSNEDTVSLDEWVFNTEAHPMRRPSPALT